MADINISDLQAVDSEMLAELSPEEMEAITGGGWLGRIAGGIVGAGIGVAIGWPSGPGMIISGAIGAGIGAGFGEGIEEHFS